MKKTDILVFAGQSNMQGESEGLPENNPEIRGALEYRFLSDSLIPLKHPVGEDIGENLLCRASNGCGTLVPSFCEEYVKKTQKRVVAVHTAKGATAISEWLAGTARYGSMVDKVIGAIEKSSEDYEVDKIYFVWLQGEADARIGTTGEEYKRMITDFKNAVKRDLKVNKFCIIQVGYYCRIVPWLELSRNGQGKLRDECIMNAQQEVCLQDSDFIMLTDICKTLSVDSEYINPYVAGHYSNKGLSIIGKTAGNALASYEKGGE